MGTLTSVQLQQILEANSKSIEIYLEVNTQYESIIDELTELKKLTGNDNETIKKVHDVLNRLEIKMKEDHNNLDSINKNIVNKLTEIDKSITRQNVILSGTVASIVLGIIAKILGFEF